MRMTPCESTPRRLAQMRIPAHSSAIGLGAPAPTKMSLANASNSTLLRVMEFSLAIRIDCRAQRGRSSDRHGLVGVIDRDGEAAFVQAPFLKREGAQAGRVQRIAFG